MMTDAPANKLSVTILTGFLGSGKTTVLNHVVTRPDWKATAVIINEFGEVGIDHMLVETSTEQMIELNNGCICCTIRGDLADKLGSLAMWIDMGRVPPVERVIVETTGLADPMPIIHTLMAETSLLERFRLEGVVTVVDAIAGLASLERFPEAVRQVAVADELILSKRDLVQELSSGQNFAALRAALQALNPRAAIHESNHGEIDVRILRSRPGSDAEAALADFDAWLAAAETGCCEESCAHPDHHHDHGERHRGIASFVVTFGSVVDLDAFNAFLQGLVIEFGANILRMKGVLDVAARPHAPAVIQGVQHVLFPVSWLKAWPDEDHESKLVFITQDLQPRTIEMRFAAHFGAPAQHPAAPGESPHARR